MTTLITLAMKHLREIHKKKVAIAFDGFVNMVVLPLIYAIAKIIQRLKQFPILARE
jgi:hypothetical protein